MLPPCRQNLYILATISAVLSVLTHKVRSVPANCTFEIVEVGEGKPTCGLLGILIVFPSFASC